MRVYFKSGFKFEVRFFQKVSKSIKRVSRQRRYKTKTNNISHDISHHVILVDRLTLGTKVQSEACCDQFGKSATRLPDSDVFLFMALSQWG
jgi:hypothetical protein